MKWRSRVVVVMCLVFGMTVPAFGNVKEDLSALEREAGIDADQDASISERLSVCSDQA